MGMSNAAIVESVSKQNESNQQAKVGSTEVLVNGPLEHSGSSGAEVQPSEEIDASVSELSSSYAYLLGYN